MAAPQTPRHHGTQSLAKSGFALTFYRIIGQNPFIKELEVVLCFGRIDGDRGPRYDPDEIVSAKRDARLPGSETIADQILRSAEAVFRQLGFERAEMWAIARGAGIAVGTIYNYFPNKWELFLRVLDEGWGQLQQEVFRLRNDPFLTGQEKLLGILAAQMRYASANAPIWRDIESMAINHQNLPGARDPGLLRERIGALIDHIRDVLDEAAPSQAHPESQHRWAISLVAIASALARSLPRDLEGNLAFLRQLLRDHAPA